MPDTRSPYQIAAANERIVSRLREREIFCSVYTVVDTVYKLYFAVQDSNHQKATRNLAVDEEQLFNIVVRRGTAADAVENSDFEIAEKDGDFYWFDAKKVTPYLGTAPDHRVVCLGDEDQTWQAQDHNDDPLEDFPSEKEAMDRTWTEWLQVEGQGFFDTAEEALEDCCEQNRLDASSYDQDNMFHYAVSGWLARHLAEIGEQVDEDFLGINVWSLTGENVDSALMKVAHRMGILVGQEFSWDDHDKAYRNRHRYRIGELVWWQPTDEPQLAGPYRVTEEVSPADTLQVISVCPIKTVHQARYDELTQLPQPITQDTP